MLQCEELTANRLVEIIYENELGLMLDKIKEAAKNFRRELYINCDYRLRESTIGQLRKLNYKIEIDCNYNRQHYVYMYKITW